MTAENKEKERKLGWLERLSPSSRSVIPLSPVLAGHVWAPQLYSEERAPQSTPSRPNNVTLPPPTELEEDSLARLPSPDIELGDLTMNLARVLAARPQPDNPVFPQLQPQQPAQALPTGQPYDQIRQALNTPSLSTPLPPLQPADTQTARAERLLAEQEAAAVGNAREQPGKLAQALNDMVWLYTGRDIMAQRNAREGQGLALDEARNPLLGKARELAFDTRVQEEFPDPMSALEMYLKQANLMNTTAHAGLRNAQTAQTNALTDNLEIMTALISHMVNTGALSPQEGATAVKSLMMPPELQ